MQEYPNITIVTQCTWMQSRKHSESFKVLK